MIKVDPIEVEAYKAKVQKVQDDFDCIKDRRVRVFQLANTVGGQYMLRRLSLADADALLARHAAQGGHAYACFYAAVHNHGSPGGRPIPLHDVRSLVAALEKNSEGVTHKYRLDACNELLVQVLGSDVSPARAFRSQPPAIWVPFKSQQQRKWERKNAKLAATSFGRSGSSGTFRLAFGHPPPAVPYLYGFSVGI